MAEEAGSPYPKEVDYRTMEAGKRRRHPAGTIYACPVCGLTGLRQVYAWRKGRYDVSYHHLAEQTHPGIPPVVKDACSVRARSVKDMPKSEQELGRG